MLYHASPVKGLEILKPNISEHGKSLVYFSEKRENVLVYLSNATEKFCKEKGVSHTGPYKKWASYGFENGILRMEEYYPNALEETYKGVSGYIYGCSLEKDVLPLTGIPFAFVSEVSVAVDECEFISDAYEEIIKAEALGKIKVQRYRDMSDEKLKKIDYIVKNEYAQSRSNPEYQFFLKNKFPHVNFEF